jgi:hypothetical protein
MKKITHLLLLALLMLGTSIVRADKTTVAGPKGGRLLENESPRAEFFVEADRTVSLTFYDANLKPVPVTEQTATAMAETKKGKEKMEFEKKSDRLVSKTPLPEGDGYTVVLQLRTKPEAKPKNFRIALHLEQCGKCKRAEYACTCDE